MTRCLEFFLWSNSGSFATLAAIWPALHETNAAWVERQTHLLSFAAAFNDEPVRASGGASLATAVGAVHEKNVAPDFHSRAQGQLRTR